MFRNKWFQFFLALMGLGFMANNVMTNTGFLGPLINRFALSWLPNGMFGIDGNIVLLIVFSVLYLILMYFGIFKDNSVK